jgi:glycosyltransferase involved in cell wall biosynthesis
MANILYFGGDGPAQTSGQRCQALRRIGHNVELFDPFAAFSEEFSSWRGALNFKSGFILIQNKLQRWLAEVTRNLKQAPDLVWIDMGELFGPKCMAVLKKLGCPIVTYNVDDPTGKRDGYRFRQFIKSIPFNDLIVVVREESARECEQLGARKVVRVYRSYDEEIHKPFASLTEIPEKFRSDVVFIGTWMRHEKRDEFLLKLMEEGVPISIWGDRWQKSPLFPKLKHAWRGNGSYGRDYVAAIQASKICIGMLSKGNRDLHTTRSLEIPFAGGLFCGERTSEHQWLYKENEEAVFWSDASECAKVCKKLLQDDPLRERIRLAGMKKVRSLQLGNEDIARQIVDIVIGAPSVQPGR